MSADAPSSSGFLSLDLTAGAGYGYVQHPGYDWVHGTGPLPRAGLGARAHLGDWRVGLDVNATYTPSMDFEGFFQLNPGYGYSYAAVGAGIVGGYVGGPLVCELQAGPAFVFAQGSTAVGVDVRLFTAFEMRFGMLGIAIGPALSAGWTEGLNVNAMLLLRPSLVFGS